MAKEITIDEALKMEKKCLIDLRSEGEFAEGAIPGAINIPLFNNADRAEVGTTYKQIGPEEAKILGLKLVGPRLSSLFEQINKATNDNEIVLYCWRGGMRSKFTTSLLSSLGTKVYRIQGGYKAYRRFVFRYLDREQLPHKFVVLAGLTGVGKTLVLKRLSETGYPVLDLEGIAKNRGSVYGRIGMPQPPSQKDFEAGIVDSLVQAESSGVIFVECESRRLGKLIVPASVMKSMADGYRILLYTSLETRVQRIIEEYTKGPNQNIELLQKSTALLKKSLGISLVEELNNKLSQGNFEEVFGFLLTNYYDPLYKYPKEPSNKYSLSVDCTNLEQAANDIIMWLKSLPEYGIPVQNGGEGHADRGNLKECQDRKGIFSGATGRVNQD